MFLKHKVMARKKILAVFIAFLLCLNFYLVNLQYPKPFLFDINFLVKLLLQARGFRGAIPEQAAFGRTNAMLVTNAIEDCIPLY